MGDPYQPPAEPDLVLPRHTRSVAESTHAVMTPARATAAGLLLAALTACGAPAPAPAPTTTPSSPQIDPVTACTSVVSYWAGVDVAGGYDVGDYQQRAMSARQDVLRQEIVDRAAAAGGASEQEITAQARVGCEALIAADPDPTGF